MRLFCHTFSLENHFRFAAGFDVFRFIEIAAAHGFVGVSLSANGPSYRWLGSGDSQHLSKIRHALVRHNLACQIDTSGTDPAHLTHMVDVAARVGATILRTYTRYLGTPAQLVELTAKDLKTIAPIAEKAEIIVALENHERLLGSDIAAILTAVDSPWVRALYDYGNSMMALEDPLIALAAMLPFAVTAHLKDHVMIAEKYDPDGRLSVLGVPNGQGHIPIAEITARLLAAGFNHVVFESSHGYRTPVQPSRITPEALLRVGQGAFAFAEPPFDPQTVCLDWAQHHPQKLLAWEWQAFEAGLKFTREVIEHLSPAS